MVKVYGIEIEDAEEICGRSRVIERKNKRRKTKIVKIPAMYDASKIRSKTLRRFVRLLKFIMASGLKPTCVDSTILDEVIQRKLNFSKRTAFDYRCAIEYLLGAE